MHLVRPHAALVLLWFTSPGCEGPEPGPLPDRGSTVETETDSGAAPDDSPADSGTSEDPCVGYDVLQVPASAGDQGDEDVEGSAAALLASVPPGCDCVLVFAEPGAYVFGSDLAFPSWTTLEIVEGSRLEVAAASTLTIDGGIEAGRWRIFGGEGRQRGSPRIDAAYPEWFGAVPGDGLDDHTGLQGAIDFFPVVSLQEGVYDVSATVVLSDGARLTGPEGDDPSATLLSALVYPETEGFHPTRLIEANGATDVVIRDLVLDGNRHAHEVEAWDFPETDNLARFEDVHGLLLEGVSITGWEANWGSDDPTLAHATAVIGSSDVAFIDVRFTDSRTEGLLFQDSEDVAIEGLFTQNTDVWTPLNAFYVTGFSLTGSTLIEDEGIEWSGSTANLTVSEAYVAGNSFTGGWGVDFGDEVGTEVFGPRGITVEDNTLETVGAGIRFSPYAEGDLVSEVRIRGNILTLHRSESAADTDELIRLDAAVDVIIEDNALYVPDTGAALARGISVQAGTDDLVVQDNTMSGVDVGVSHSGDSPNGGDLSVLRNTITCASEIRVDSWNGGSTGVWVFRYLAARFDSVLVADNDIEAHGGWVTLIDYASLFSDPDPFVDQLTVTGNDFLPKTGSERNVASDGASSVTISGNTPHWVNP